jgi:archaellum component FlaC
MANRDNLCNKILYREGCKRKGCYFSHDKRRVSKEIFIEYAYHSDKCYIIGKDANDREFYIQWSHLDDYIKFKSIFSDEVTDDYKNMIFYGHYDINSLNEENNRYRFIKISKITVHAENDRSKESKKCEEINIESLSNHFAIDSLSSWSPTSVVSSPESHTGATKEDVDKITEFLNETSVEVSCIKQHFSELKKIISDQITQTSSLKKIISDQTSHFKKVTSEQNVQIKLLKKQLSNQTAQTASLKRIINRVENDYSYYEESRKRRKW